MSKTKSSSNPNLICPQCGTKYYSYKVESNIPITKHNSYRLGKTLNPLFTDINKLEIGECITINNEEREQRASQLAFSANSKFKPKRFTSRYDKIKKIARVFRIHPGGEFDLGMNK